MIDRLFKGVLGEVDSSPFAPRNKMSLLGTLGSIISLGTEIAQPILGAVSSSNANNTNLEIQRETNKQNYQMFKENQAWQEDMWNKQNDYNLPSNVVQRLKVAGINPAAVFGNGSATPAGSVGSVNTPQMQAARVNPYLPDLSGVGESVNAFFRNQLTNKAIEGQGLDNQAKMIDNQFRAMKHIGDLLEQKTRVDKMISETDKNSEERSYLVKQSQYLQGQIDLFKDNYSELVRRERLQNDVMENQANNLLADSTLKRAQARFQNILSQFYPQMAAAQIDLMSSQALQAVETTEQLVREHRLTDQKSANEYLQNQLLNIKIGREESVDRSVNRNQYTRAVKGFSDFVTSTIFGNIKLFGK